MMQFYPSYLAVLLLIMKTACETADQYKDIILKTHNDYRRQQGGSNINELVRSFYYLLGK